MTKFLQKTEETNPFTFMRRVSEELDRAFGLKPDVPGYPELYRRAWTPDLEVFERDNKFFVRVDLPGLKKEDVKIEIAHDELTITGERKLEKEEKRENFYRTERTYGTFFRRIEIPEHVKAEDAVATFKEGVLQIEMPTLPVPPTNKRLLEIKE